jgi:hypothetical protein
MKNLLSVAVFCLVLSFVQSVEAQQVWVPAYVTPAPVVVNTYVVQPVRYVYVENRPIVLYAGPFFQYAPYYQYYQAPVQYQSVVSYAPVVPVYQSAPRCRLFRY